MPPTARSFARSSAMTLPGSTVSGEYASENSPTDSPEVSRIGATVSTVVPGGTVDSRITVSPARSTAATASAALSTKARSARSPSSGVGTQTRW